MPSNAHINVVVYECDFSQSARSSNFPGVVPTSSVVLLPPTYTLYQWAGFHLRLFSRFKEDKRQNVFFSRSLGHVYVLCPLPAFSEFGKMQHWHCHPQRSGFTPGLCPEECHLGAFGDDLNRSQVLMKQTAAISCLHGIHGLPIQPGWPCCFALGFRKGDESAGAERWKHRSLRNGEGPLVSTGSGYYFG